MKMWSFLESRKINEHIVRRYKEYDEKYPWLWPLITKFKLQTPEKFVITREQYDVLLEEPEFIVSGYRTGNPSSYKIGWYNDGYVPFETKWVAKTIKGVPIYVEGPTLK
jgi:hypothetical protein